MMKRPGAHETQATHSFWVDEVSFTRIARGHDDSGSASDTTVVEGRAMNEAPPTFDGKYSCVAPRRSTPMSPPPGARVVTASVARSTFLMLPGH